MITIHRPNFIPYLGFFQKVLKCDILVIYDICTYAKEDYINRNSIVHKMSPYYLTLRANEHAWNMLMKDVQIGGDKKDKEILVRKHIGVIKDSYKKSINYNKYIETIINMYLQYCNIDTMMEFNMLFIKYFLELFEWKGQIIYASSLNIQFNENDSKTEKLCKIISKCYFNSNATYLSGIGGKTYIDESILIKYKIKLMYDEFIPTKYSQLSMVFIPNMSILDFVFNNDAKEIYKYIL